MSTMKAFVATDDGKGEVREGLPVPSYGPTEVLVKVRAAAVNPTDWKHVDRKMTVDGSVVGIDFAGDVVAVGSEVKDRKVGDQVFGLVNGASIDTPGRGAYAQYVAVESYQLFNVTSKLDQALPGSKIPQSLVSTYEGAASLPCAILTTAIALFFFDKTPIKKNAVTGGKFFLVWGGASSVGVSTIQIAHYLGYRVIATASPHNFGFVESLGAEKVFDYKDPNVVKQIKEYTNDSVVVAYDCISLPTTFQLVHDSMSDKLSGVVHNTLGLNPEKDIKNFKSDLLKYTFPLAYLVVVEKKGFGVGGPVFTSPEGLIPFMKEVWPQMNNLLVDPEAHLRHMPITVLEHGLESARDGLDLVRDGKNSGTKIVFQIE